MSKIFEEIQMAEHEATKAATGEKRVSPMDVLDHVSNPQNQPEIQQTRTAIAQQHGFSPEEAQSFAACLAQVDQQTIDHIKEMAGSPMQEHFTDRSPLANSLVNEKRGADMANCKGQGR